MIIYRCDCCGRDFFKEKHLTEYHIPHNGYAPMDLEKEAKEYLDKQYTLDICDECAKEISYEITNTINKIHIRVHGF